MHHQGVDCVVHRRVLTFLDWIFANFVYSPLFLTMLLLFVCSCPLTTCRSYVNKHPASSPPRRLFFQARPLERLTLATSYAFVAPPLTWTRQHSPHHTMTPLCVMEASAKSSTSVWVGLHFLALLFELFSKLKWEKWWRAAAAEWVGQF